MGFQRRLFDTLFEGAGWIALDLVKNVIGSTVMIAL